MRRRHLKTGDRSRELAEKPDGASEVRDFHRLAGRREFSAGKNLKPGLRGNPRQTRLSAETASGGCTNFGHALVDDVHSIENTHTYNLRFFVDSKNRRSTTRSFFDSFLSFSSWCGVRGSSEVTFSDRKVEKEGKQGSIAKRWLRRTGKKC